MFLSSAGAGDREGAADVAADAAAGTAAAAAAATLLLLLLGGEVAPCCWRDDDMLFQMYLFNIDGCKAKDMKCLTVGWADNDRALQLDLLLT